MAKSKNTKKKIERRRPSIKDNPLTGQGSVGAAIQELEQAARDHSAGAQELILELTGRSHAKTPFEIRERLDIMQLQVDMQKEADTAILALARVYHLIETIEASILDGESDDSDE